MHAMGKYKRRELQAKTGQVTRKTGNMELLFVSPTYGGTSGVGNHVKMLREHLQRAGHKVDLISTVNTAYLPIKKLKNPSFMITASLKTYFTVPNPYRKYNVLHAFNAPSSFPMQANQFSNKKVLSIHGVYRKQVDIVHTNRFVRQIGAWLERKGVKWTDHLTTDSLHVKKHYEDKYGVEVTHLASPIDVDAIPSEAERLYDKQVAFIGRKSPEKGLNVLKKAMKRVKAQLVTCTNKPWLETMKLLRGSDILVLPSIADSLPTVVKEAIACKVPVIASCVGGVPEMIRNGETGLLVPPNDVDSLTSALKTLLGDEDLRRRLAINGYKLIQNYTWKKWLPQYLAFYERVLCN